MTSRGPDRSRLMVRSCGLLATGLVLCGCGGPSAGPGSPSGAPAQRGETVPVFQRSTREVLDARRELQEDGVRLADPRLPESGIVTYPLNALSDARAQIAQIQVQDFLRTFYAVQGRYPEDYEEFKREILDKNPQLTLPALPPHKKYGYDVEKHELIILEYPKKRKGPD